MSFLEIIKELGAVARGKARIEIVRKRLSDRQLVPVAAFSQKEAVTRVAWLADRLEFVPASIIDAGASDGRWTRAALEFFPKAKILLIEPLQEHEELLEALIRKEQNLVYCQGILADQEKTVHFNAAGHQSSLYGDVAGRAFGRQKEMTSETLDGVIKRIGFPQPDFIKMDIEGGELEALKGATKALESAQLIQIETSFLPFKKDFPLLSDIVCYLDSVGFRPLDIFGVHGRPLDRLPAQCECVFIRKETTLIKDFRWAGGLAWS